MEELNKAVNTVIASIQKRIKDDWGWSGSVEVACPDIAGMGYQNRKTALIQALQERGYTCRIESDNHAQVVICTGIPTEPLPTPEEVKNYIRAIRIAELPPATQQFLFDLSNGKLKVVFA